VKKIKVIEIVNQLGLGGTEYALQLFAKFFDKKRFDVTVISLITGGERVEILKALNIDVVVLNGNFDDLEVYLRQADVVHWHGGGSLESELFQSLRQHKPSLVIQTNVFGSYEPSPLYDLIDYDLYISNMILVRRMALDKQLHDNFLSKRKVLPYPVDIDDINNSLPSEKEILQFRVHHKLDGNFIVGRIGRPDNHKFDLITLDGFAKFAANIENTKFLLVGATNEMMSHARSLGISDKIVIVENTVQLKTLLIYYKSMDVFLAASRIGESFGMVIAEAMVVGTPVVTISTQDRDNAQIELMDNEESGIVVRRSKTAIAQALKHLYKKPEDRIKLSNNSKLKIARDYKAQKIVRSLEQLIFKHFNLPTDEYNKKSLIKDYSQEMINDYERRCQNLFDPFKVLNQSLTRFKRLFRIFLKS
jgi:glycosyltransferase involved in cell wall biosynthesis